MCISVYQDISALIQKVTETPSDIDVILVTNHTARTKTFFEEIPFIETYDILYDFLDVYKKPMVLQKIYMQLNPKNTSSYNLSRVQKFTSL